MGSNQRKWDISQRQAIIREFLKGERAMLEILAAAESGDLLDTEGRPFPSRVPVDTAYAWIRRHREAEADKPAPPRDQIANTLDAALKIAREELEIEAKKAPGRRDVGRVKQITGALKDADALRKSLDSTPPDVPDDAGG